jgi:uncharacterized membrane-anchored protein
MEAPKLPSFIRQNKHKTFEFKPRYYDESKERIDDLRKKYHKSGESQKAKVGGEAMRAEMQQKWTGNRAAKVQSSNRRLLYIVIGLFAVAYYILRFSDILA